MKRISRLAKKAYVDENQAIDVMSMFSEIASIAASQRDLIRTKMQYYPEDFNFNSINDGLYEIEDLLSQLRSKI